MKITSPYFKKDYDLSKSQLVGEGNFAQVYRLFDSQLNQFLAIRKVLKSQAEHEDLAKQKQINEQLIRVENQNILKIYDIIDSPQYIWYITEYCEGGSLWDALNGCKDNKMNQKDALQAILQISKGVQQLHNHRITHRDLKPQNILLTSKYVAGKPLPVVKLADFGLSTKEIIMQTIAGTKQYIAPEQAKFQNYTNAVDVWSLGIICDQILHGTPYYSGENNKEVFNKILKIPYVVRDEKIRQSIQQFLMSLLKKKPYQRPIIAVIRKNLQNILTEIKGQNKSRINENFQKKNQLMNYLNIKKKKKDNQNQISKQTQDNEQSSITSNKRHRNIAAESIKNNFKPLLNKYSSNDSITNLLSHSTPIKPHVQEQKTPRSKAANKRIQNKEQTINTSQTEDNLKQIKGKNLVQRKNAKNENSDLFKSVTNVAPKINPQKYTSIPQPQQKTPKKNYAENNKKVQEQATMANMLASSIDLNQLKKQQNNSNRQNSIKKSINLSNNEKIQVHKFDKKKPLLFNNSSKNQTKFEFNDISIYSKRVYYKKMELLQQKIKTVNDRSFIPNAYLNTIQINTKYYPEQSFLIFKKKLNFLNYYSSSNDYEIKIHKGKIELQKIKIKCEEEFKQYKNAIKSAFFQQLDTFVDNYVEKIIK